MLAKLGVFDLDERFALDLSPLKKLIYLQELRLGGPSIKNIKPLAGLISLKKLDLEYTRVSDLEPLMGLINLQTLSLGSYSRYGLNLGPLQNLTNLKKLVLYNNRDKETNFSRIYNINSKSYLCFSQIQREIN